MPDEIAPLRSLRQFVDSRLLPSVDLADEVLSAAIVIAHFARATSTFDAIIALAERGLGSQALMLDRALYELMINAWWSRLDVDAAEELFVGFAQLDWQIRRDKARTYPSILGELADHEELSGDERARLVGIYGAFGHKGWTGKPLRQRVADLEAAGRGPGLGEPWAFYDVVTYLSNQELHGSSWSLGRVVRGVQGAEGVTRLQIRTGGAEDDLVEVAIHCAWWMYFQLVELIIEEFKVPILDELERIQEQAADAFGLGTTADGDD